MEDWFGHALLWAIFIFAMVVSYQNGESIKREWILNSKKKDGYNLDFPSLQKHIEGQEWQEHVNNHFAKRKKSSDNIGMAIALIGIVALVYFGAVK